MPPRRRTPDPINLDLDQETRSRIPMPDYERYGTPDYGTPNYGRRPPIPGSLEDVLSRESGAIRDGVPTLRRPFPGVDEILEAVDDLENADTRRRADLRRREEAAERLRASDQLRGRILRGLLETRHTELTQQVAQMEASIRDFDNPAVTQMFESLKLVLEGAGLGVTARKAAPKKKPSPPAKPVKKSAWERLDDDAFEDE
jgi:hypothetical protein